MKVLVCGKGGSGKSTLTTLLSRTLQKRGYNVLVVDADESNFGLCAQLGYKAPRELMGVLGGKKAVQNKMGKYGGDGHKAPVLNETLSISSIPEEAVAGEEGLHFVQVGKVHHYGEGCACPMGVLAKDFLNHLKLGERDIAVVDTEAGVEHLGRGLVGAADLILAVVDPSFESIKLAEKYSAMAAESQKPLWFVLNRLEADTAQFLTQRIGAEKIVAALPYCRAVLEAGLKGEALKAELPEVETVTDFVVGGKW